MKRVLLLLPAVLSVLLYTALGIFGSFSAINPLVWLMTAILFISGFSMLRNKLYACIGGIFLGCYLIYMSMQYTGQTIDIECPMGIALIIYYSLCGLFIFKENKEKRISQ